MIRGGPVASPRPSSDHARLTRRSVAIGSAWAIPTIAAATAAPAFAASPTKVPGINGWVLNRVHDESGSCRYSISVDSRPPAPQPPTADGAPYGLYVYDVEPMNTFSDISLVYWIIGTHTATSNTVTWEALSGHSGCWSTPVRGSEAIKADGFTYTPYTFRYTCTPQAADAEVGMDGYVRLYLGDFRAVARFTQPSSLCNNVTYWAQRFVTIDPDGAGYRPPVQYSFERRNGTLGPYSGRTRSARAVAETPAGQGLVS